MAKKQLEKYIALISKGEDSPKKVSLFKSTDKQFFEIAEKLYNDKEINIEEAAFVLSYALSNSPIYEKIKDHPGEIKIVEMPFEKKGRHSFYEIKINSNLLKNAKGSNKGLSEILTTLFHENTHRLQVISQIDKADETGNKSYVVGASSIKDTLVPSILYKLIEDKLSKDEKMSNEDIARATKGIYLFNNQEVEAREKGSFYAKEFLNSILKSKKISNELKNHIIDDINKIEKEDKETKNKEAIVKEQYIRIKTILKKIDIIDLISCGDSIENDKQQIASYNKFFELWAEDKNFDDLSDAYVSLLGTGESFGRKKLVDMLKNGPYPMSQKNEFIETLTSILEKGELSIDVYEKELIDVLPVSKITQLYKKLIVNGKYDKLSLPLFDNIKLAEYPKVKLETGLILVSAIENGYDNKYIRKEIKNLYDSGLRFNKEFKSRLNDVIKETNIREDTKVEEKVKNKIH